MGKTVHGRSSVSVHLPMCLCVANLSEVQSQLRAKRASPPPQPCIATLGLVRYLLDIALGGKALWGVWASRLWVGGSSEKFHTLNFFWHLVAGEFQPHLAWPMGLRSTGQKHRMSRCECIVRNMSFLFVVSCQKQHLPKPGSRCIFPALRAVSGKWCTETVRSAHIQCIPTRSWAWHINYVCFCLFFMHAHACCSKCVSAS